MKVLALTRYDHLGASSRLRIYQYVPLLQAMGINIQVSPLLRDEYLKRLYAKQPTNWLAIFADYFTQALKLLNAKKFDLLWIEKELFPNLPAWFEQALHTLGIKYVVDYDDAVFHNYDLSSHPAKQFLRNKIDLVMRNSALVVCGNNYLAERAYSAEAKHIEIIPTVIDIERYAVTSEKNDSKLIVGWIGSWSTAKYLEIIVPALQILATEFPLQLRLIGADFAAPDLDIDCRLWSENAEAREIQQFDVGIMPLLDEPWERGKCGYKLIQYMACGKAVIASPVGVNQEIVKQGINGYLSSSIDEWVQAFRVLFLNKQQREAMGAVGREWVEKKYCVQITAPHLAQLFHKVIENK